MTETTYKPRTVSAWFGQKHHTIHMPAGVPGREPTPRYEAIDGLRAMAMIAVIAQHTDLVPFGWIGVWVFYVISGFVVALSVRGLKDLHAPSKQFYIRRAARIVPMYALYVVLVTLIALPIDPTLSPLGVLSQFSFTYNLFVIHDWRMPLVPTTHLWTISVEMQFYLIAGVAIVKLSRRRLVQAMIAVIAMCLMARALLAWTFAPDFDVITHLGFVTFDAFAAGCLLELYKHKLTPARGAFMLGIGCLAMIGYFATYMVVNHGMGARGIEMTRRIISGNCVGQGRDIVLFSAVTLLGVGLVSTAAAGKGMIARFLARPLIVMIGRASYSGYLIHFGMIVVLRAALLGAANLSPALARAIGHGPGKVVFALVLFVAAVGVTVAISLLLYRQLEIPLARATRDRLNRVFAFASP